MNSTLRLSSDQLESAAEFLKNGELVAFPTETVYGLGAQIFLSDAIEKIFKVKGRPADNPLIVHACTIEQIEQVAQRIPDLFFTLADHFFPGPLTIVLKRNPQVPAIVSAGLDTVAVRIPSHLLARKLISLVGAPLVAPSANLSGKPSSTQTEHVLEDFDGKIAAVIDGGKTEIGIESTVISLVHKNPILLRPGAISKEGLEKVLGMPVEVISSQYQGPVISPGLKHRHYCPLTPVKLFNSEQEAYVYLAANAHKKHLFIARQPLSSPLAHVNHFPLSMEGFYAGLRLADQCNYEEIVLFCDQEIQQLGGLMNRILRAAGCL